MGDKSEFERVFAGVKESANYKSPSVDGASGTGGRSSEPAVLRKGAGGCILVSSRQRGNAVLKFVKGVAWEYDDSIVPDYVLGERTCAMFLSVRYHTLNPDYVHDRLRGLGGAYELRVLLVLVDVKDPHHALKQLMRICILANMTLMLAWSAEEAAKVLETYKLYENKSADMIMEKAETDPYGQIVSALTAVRSINRTDAATLLNNFGTLKKVINATEAEIALCPGLGPNKARKLVNVLKKDFKKTN